MTTESAIVFSSGKYVPENMSEEIKKELGLAEEDASQEEEQEFSLSAFLDGGICFANWLWQKPGVAGMICEKDGVFITYDSQFVHADGSKASKDEIVAAYHDEPEFVAERAWHAMVHGVYYVNGRARSEFED